MSLTTEDVQCCCESVTSYFDSLSDDIILCIFKYITNLKDLFNLRRINKRLSVIAEDKTLAHRIDCRGQYWLSTRMFEEFFRPHTKYVEYLNMDNCYWLRPTDLELYLSCTRLRSLHVMHIDIPAHVLCQVLSIQTQLTSLSISISNIQDFHEQLAASPRAQETLRHLVQLTLHFSNNFYHGYTPVINFSSVTPLFEYCRDVQEIHVRGGLKSSRAVAQSFIQPQEYDVRNLKNLRVLTLNDSTDPLARVVFFETLHHACTLPVKLTTLLMTGCTDDQRCSRHHYVNAMQSNDSLVHFEASGSNINLPNVIYNVQSAYNMQYINVSGNQKVGQLKLRAISELCPNVESLNLESCGNLLLEHIPDGNNVIHEWERIYDATDLENLIDSCRKLRSLNLSGVHIHPEFLDTSSYENLASLLCANTNWQSLSLPSCCLNTEHSGCCTADETTRDVLVNMLCRKRRLSRADLPDPMLTYKRQQPESDFQRLIRLTADLEHFELICPKFTSAFSKEHGVLPTASSNEPCKASLRVVDCDLKSLSGWNRLKSLQLTGIAGMKVGHCLRAIGQGCTSLERLYLSCLGPSTHCTYKHWLVRSLPLFSKLKDFRLEQPHLAVDVPLLSAVGKCSTLERICIIAVRGTFSSEGVERLFVSLPGLINFQLYTDDPVGKCVKMKDFLLEQYQEERPALSVCVYPLFNPYLQQVIDRDVPDQHFDEMTILKSRVAIRPTSM